VSVSVNVSDRELWHEDLLAVLLATLERHHLSADRLTLEITKARSSNAPKRPGRSCTRCTDAGLRLHIGDFGTGRSSLETLHRFPVDAFKIDRSVIGDLETDPRTVDLVRALVTIGRPWTWASSPKASRRTASSRSSRTSAARPARAFWFMPAVSADVAHDLIGRELGAQDVQDVQDVEGIPA